MRGTPSPSGKRGISRIFAPDNGDLALNTAIIGGMEGTPVRIRIPTAPFDLGGTHGTKCGVGVGPLDHLLRYAAKLPLPPSR